MSKHRESHAKLVYWSDEDQCYIGMCPSLFGGGVHGPDEMKVWRDLCQVVEEWERDLARTRAKSRSRARTVRRSASSGKHRG